MRTLLGGVLCAAMVCGCAEYEVENPSARQGARQLALEDRGNGVYRLKVAKSAEQQGTEFLLSTSAISRMWGDPAFFGTLSRVVVFKRADGKVHMLESNKGTAVDPALVKPQVLMSFPIEEEDETTLELGFNAGAQSVFASSDWWASDFDHPSMSAIYRNVFVKLQHAYVDEGVTDAAGRIRIRQVANADLGGLVDAVELRYFLQPYSPDKSYVPLRSSQDFRRVGFFEASPTVRQGTATYDIHVARFHPGKPLTYALSANTPPAAKQAIQDGILYWNRALGREWIKVVDAPARVTAPDLDYNLVQWVNEKGALFAYADAQLDPLTGEVRNAQIFLPSGWYFDSVDEAVYAYARLPNRKSAMGKAQTAVGQGLRARTTANRGRSVGACARGDVQHFARGLESLAARGLSPSDLQRVSLDWLRAVVAHEVGHTLGLRHNFAGSLGTNVSRAELPELMKAYFATGNWPAHKLPGSSVMEYPVFEDDVAIGARIRLGQPALGYDVAAMGVLYANKPVPTTTGPLFCTDFEASIGTSLDCAAFDQGASHVDGWDARADKYVANAAAEYLYWLRLAKSAEESDVFAWTDARWDGTRGPSMRYQVVKALSNASQLLAADRAVASPHATSPDAIHKDSLARVQKSLVASGGYARYFETLPPDFAAAFQAQLNTLLASPWATRGRSIRGRPWTFSAAELAQIRAYAPQYAADYAKAHVKAEVATLSMRDPLLDYVLEQQPEMLEFFMPGPELQWEAPGLSFTGTMEDLLASRAEALITAVKGTQSAKVMVAPEGETGEPTLKTVALPLFTHDTDLRTSAVMMLDPARAKSKAWAWEARKGLKANVTAQLDGVAGVPFMMLQADGSSDFGKEWILDNQSVVELLEMISLAGAPPPMPW